MRTNGKCNNSHAPSTDLAILCFPSEPNIPEGPEYAKNINVCMIKNFNLKKSNALYI